MYMKLKAGCTAIAFAFCASAGSPEFGTPGGPEPANLREIAGVLEQDPYDLELLISFGTSKGGSAGHLALAVRDRASGDETVWSANFYADRKAEHQAHHYTDDLMVRIPKWEYLFGTTSTLSPKASFGLDFGEIYKRSVIGVRVYGVPKQERDGLVETFRRINDDYHARASGTDYHRGEVKYDYLRMNCAKTIGTAFKFGAGYRDLEVDSATLLRRSRIVAALNANIPTEMAMKLMREWSVRGYGMDVVLYRKYDGSSYVDPYEDETVAFRNLPNRFPSVLSRDFRKDRGEYEDIDNLFAMYVLYNMGRYSVRVNDATKLLEIADRKLPMPYPEAAERAQKSAQSDSENYGRQRPFRSLGTRIGDTPSN